MWRSDVLRVSDQGRQIETFLFAPPSAVFSPLMGSLRRSARVLLPPPVSRGFYGGSVSKVARVRACAGLGVCRFLYRLLPLSARALTPYLAMERRNGRRRGPLSTLLARASAAAASAFLRLAMPPR